MMVFTKSINLDTIPLKSILMVKELRTPLTNYSLNPVTLVTLMLRVLVWKVDNKVKKVYSQSTLLMLMVTPLKLVVIPSKLKLEVPMVKLNPTLKITVMVLTLSDTTLPVTVIITLMYLYMINLLKTLPSKLELNLPPTLASHMLKDLDYKKPGIMNLLISLFTLLIMMVTLELKEVIPSKLELEDPMVIYNLKSLIMEMVLIQ